MGSALSYTARLLSAKHPSARGLGATRHACGFVSEHRLYCLVSLARQKHTMEWKGIARLWARQTLEMFALYRPVTR